MKQDMLR